MCARGNIWTKLPAKMVFSGLRSQSTQSCSVSLPSSSKLTWLSHECVCVHLLFLYTFAVSPFLFSSPLSLLLPFWTKKCDASDAVLYCVKRWFEINYPNCRQSASANRLTSCCQSKSTAVSFFLFACPAIDAIRLWPLGLWHGPFLVSRYSLRLRDAGASFWHKASQL